MNWKDVTSYYQDDKVRAPRTFEARAGKLRIVLTRHLDYMDNEWVLKCMPFIRGLSISTGNIEQAQEAAKTMLIKELSDALEGIS